MSRRAQPYRVGNPLRLPGGALEAMLRGRTLHGTNPADVMRMAQKLTGSKHPPLRLSRPPRATRPPRSR